MHKNFKKIAVFVFCSVLMYLLFFDIYNRFLVAKQKAYLKNCKSQTIISSIVYMINHVPKSSSVNIYYTFKFNNKEYNNDRKVIGKSNLPITPFSLLVVIDSLEPSKNYLLSSAEDFKDFKKSIPDSLLINVECFE